MSASQLAEVYCTTGNLLAASFTFLASLLAFLTALRRNDDS